MTITTSEPAIAPAINALDLVPVQETTLPCGIVVPAFRVGRYLTGRDDDGALRIDAEAAPWVRINYSQARMAASAAGLSVIAELQWLAIAHQIAGLAENWTGGEVGLGTLYQGLHRGRVDCAMPGSYEPEAADERRWHVLANGEHIYDFAGNAFSWVRDDVQGDEEGLVAKPFADDSPSLATAPYPSLKKGMGWRPKAGRDWSGGALIRGGCWRSGADAGVFFLDSVWPDSRRDDVGFRSTAPGL